MSSTVMHIRATKVVILQPIFLPVVYLSRNLHKAKKYLPENIPKRTLLFHYHSEIEIARV